MVRQTEREREGISGLLYEWTDSVTLGVDSEPHVTEPLKHARLECLQKERKKKRKKKKASNHQGIITNLKKRLRAKFFPALRLPSTENNDFNSSILKRVYCFLSALLSTLGLIVNIYSAHHNQVAIFSGISLLLTGLFAQNTSLVQKINSSLTTSSSDQHFSISLGTGFFTRRCSAFPAS